MTPQAEHIKMILGNTSIINEAKLAQKLHIKQTTLNYQFNHATKFDTSLYNQIIQIFKMEGIIPVSDKDEECTRLNSLTLDLSSEAGMILSKLQTSVKTAIENNEVDEKERKEIISHLIDAQTNLMLNINSMLRLLGYKE